MGSKITRIPVSEFKAVCLRLFREIQTTKAQIIITRGNQDIALISPPPMKKKKKVAFGALKEKMKVAAKVDLTEPLDIEWEALK